MSYPIPPGPGRGPVEPCEWCGVVLLVAVIAGCYVAGFGYSGWLAIAIGLHVWLLGFLFIRHTGKTQTPTDKPPHTKPE